MNQLLDQLATAREHLASAQAMQKQMLETFRASENFVHVEAVRITASAEIERITAEIERNALVAYNATGDKHPHPKVEVKTFKVVEIVSPSLARAWCFENLPSALKLDDAMVKKYVKEFSAVDGTTVHEEPRVQIASKLDSDTHPNDPENAD